MCLRKAWEECGRRVHGLDLCVGDARNASEIAIQGWHVKRERESVWVVPLVKEGQRSRRC